MRTNQIASSMYILLYTAILKKVIIVNSRSIEESKGIVGFKQLK